MKSFPCARGHVGRASFAYRPLAPIPTLIVTLVVCAMPAPAESQTNVILAGHVGSSPAAPGGVMADVAAEVRQGVLGARVGVGMDASATAIGPMFASRETSSGAWAADGDLGLNVGRVPYVGLLFGRTDPTLFIGAGLAGISLESEPGRRSTSVTPTWSYGVRAAYPIASWLGVEVEARNRRTIDEVTPDVYPIGEGWEYRAGIALRFGGSGTSRPARASRGGVGSRGGIPASRPGSRDVRVSASAEEIADGAIRTGEQYLGTPYRWGGTSPTQGFDCSGFVQYVFGRQGIALPRVSRDQARAGRLLDTSLDGLARGDLLFFAQNGTTVDHVAIYTGNGRILHSSSSGRGVRYDDLSGNRGRWYVQHLVAVRRVVGEARGSGSLTEPGVSSAPSRQLPLDDAFDAILSERGDAAPPPEN